MIPECKMASTFSFDYIQHGCPPNSYHFSFSSGLVPILPSINEFYHFKASRGGFVSKPQVMGNPSHHGDWSIPLTTGRLAVESPIKSINHQPISLAFWLEVGSDVLPSHSSLARWFKGSRKTSDKGVALKRAKVLKCNWSPAKKAKLLEICTLFARLTYLFGTKVHEGQGWTK